VSFRIQWHWRNAELPGTASEDGVVRFLRHGRKREAVGRICRDRHAAAIASESAARYYGAQILEAGIEDNPENFTRFFLVRRTRDARFDSDATKPALAFSVENRPGSLVAALNQLAEIGTNLTKIEVTPRARQTMEYVFYVDCQLHSLEEGSRAIEAIKPHCAMVKELGRYRESTVQGNRDWK